MIEHRQAILGGLSAVCTAISGIIGNKVLDEPWLSSAGVGFGVAFVSVVCVTAAVEFARGTKISTIPKSDPAEMLVTAQGPSLPPSQSQVSPPEGSPSLLARVVRHVIIPASVASLLGAAAALLAIALTIVISPAGVTQSTGQPTHPPTQPPTGSPSSNAPVPAHAVKISATPGDAGSGFGDEVAVTVTVAKPLPPADSYWLIAQFTGSPNTVYKAHDQVLPTQGRYSFTVSLASAQVGSVRTFYVVAAYAGGTRLLRQNYDHQYPSWDGNRTSLPSHSFVVSNRVLVTKQRG